MKDTTLKCYRCKKEAVFNVRIKVEKINLDQVEKGRAISIGSYCKLHGLEFIKDREMK